MDSDQEMDEKNLMKFSCEENLMLAKYSQKCKRYDGK
jgi:hypothetical protein